MRRLAAETGLLEPTARVLVQRGVRTADEASEFVNTPVSALHSPWRIPDMTPAVERVGQAIDSREPILVHGDYDVDGLSATALLTGFLTRLNADVSQYIPHRIEEGYGLGATAIRQAKESGIRLIITVDCGTRDAHAISQARAAGIDVIVTDHHEPGQDLPPALAVLNPKRHDSAYPFRDLAGVGVAMKLAQALVEKRGLPLTSFFRGYLDLVALGTVADVVPVLGENRILVRYGLDCLRHTRKTGLRALIRVAGYENKAIDAFAVGFGLGPRLNAVGRLDTGETALRLLLTQDRTEADDLARQLDAVNYERRQEELRTTEQALAQVDDCMDLDRERVVVVSAPDWHPGVVGIVASRVRERVYRPAIVLAELEGIAKGSCRSIEGFDISAALDSTRGLLIRHGGHAMAAGLELRLELLDRFRDEINAYARQTMPDELLRPVRMVDGELNPEDVSLRLCNELARLAPFGTGNPEPVFVCRQARIELLKRVGDGSHLKLRVSGPTSSMLVEGIAFSMGDLADELHVGETVEMCFSAQANEWNGSVLPQMLVRGIRPAAARVSDTSDTRRREYDDGRQGYSRFTEGWDVPRG